MKSLIWMPLGLAAAAGVALLILRGATGQLFLRETLIAAGIAVVASEAAMVPLVIVRRGSTLAMSQASLVGTVLHMFLAFVLGAVAYSMKLVGQRNYFMFLLLGFYWVSLVLIVIAMIKSVRRAAPPAPEGGHSTDTGGHKA